MIEIADTIHLPYPRPHVFEAGRLLKLFGSGNGFCFESTKRKISMGVLLGVSVEGFSKVGDIKGKVEEFIPNELVRIVGGSRFVDLSMAISLEDYRGVTNASYDFTLGGSNQLGKVIIGGLHEPLLEKITGSISGYQENLAIHLQERAQEVA